MSANERPQGDFLAGEVLALVEGHQYTAARKLVRQAADEGRVHFDAADAHNDGVARVMIDGFFVGQASSLLLFDFKLDTSRTTSGRVIPVGGGSDV